jgi:hypothetical protein
MKRVGTFGALTLLALFTLPLSAATQAEADLNASLTAYHRQANALGRV